MGVCCIVFDIDGMLFEFFMNFLNIEKNKIIFFFQYFKFSSRFMLFPTLKKNWCPKIRGRAGGCGFFCTPIFSHFTFYAIFNIKKNIEKCPFTYWLNGRWFLQIVERDSWNLYPLYPLFPCSDFVSQMWGWFGGGGGGGGVMFFSHFMLFPTFLEKKIWGYKTIISHLMFSSCFFVCWKYSCPFTYRYWLNGRWFLQIVDIGNFIMRLEILKSASSLTG